MAVNGISFRGKSLNDVVDIIRSLINGDMGNEGHQSTITLQFGREKKPTKRSEVSISVLYRIYAYYVCICLHMSTHIYCSRLAYA